MPGDRAGFSMVEDIKFFHAPKWDTHLGVYLSEKTRYTTPRI